MITKPHFFIYCQKYTHDLVIYKKLKNNTGINNSYRKVENVVPKRIVACDKNLLVL